MTSGSSMYAMIRIASPHAGQVSMSIPTQIAWSDLEQPQAGPKIGDAAAWQARIAQSMDAMIGNAINGKNGMPPKGGRMDLSDDDVVAATAYMVEVEITRNQVNWT